MRISHARRFVFIAYPRTGSTSVGRLLDPYSDLQGGHIGAATAAHPFFDHITARELGPIFRQRGWDWGAYRHFCFVRNPFERAVSLFRHRLGEARRWDPHNRLRGNLNNLLLRFLPRRSAFYYYLATRSPSQGVAANLQAYICAADGTRLVETVLRFEEFGQALAAYLPTLGIDIQPAQIPHLNANPEDTAGRNLYTAAARRQVERLYGWEIEQFGYR